MMKSICALGHRPGTTRQAFQAYYESNHAPLAVGFFPFRRYVRNHLIDAEDIGFDTISEFWAEDIADFGVVQASPAGRLMRADEEKFMNRLTIASGTSTEHVLSAGDEGALRQALLVDWDGDDAQLLDWARALAADLPGVSADFIMSWGVPPFPSRAVLWAPPGIDPLAPAGFGVRALQVRRAVTPTDQLLK